MTIKLRLFYIVLVANILALFGLIITLLFPKTRIWPPPRKRSWQFWYTWILYYVGMIGVPILGILDWETLNFIPWARFLIGGSLIFIAIPLAIWSVRTLGVDQTSGLKGILVTWGPYHYTRNPQYLANIFFFTGVILITSSSMSLKTGILVILWFVLAPFSEEPWLRQQFGKKFDEYCSDVPRFIDLRSFRSKQE